MTDVTITNDAWMAKQREIDALREVVLVAKEMRSAQRRYFKERTQSALVESKRLEKELDRLLDHLCLTSAQTGRFVAWFHARHND